MSVRLALASLALALVAAACSGPGGGAPVDAEPLPPIDGQLFQELVTTSDRPMVVNVWASWCIPCRSEAPLLRSAHATAGDQVRFIGIDVADTQEAALAFLAEFDLTFENYFDPDRTVPASLGRTGVPLTFFFRAGGELEYAHLGAIDERTLALHIDELLAG